MELLDCIKKHIKHKDMLIDFLKMEIKMREYVCATNHAVLLDIAEQLLKSIEEDEIVSQSNVLGYADGRREGLNLALNACSRRCDILCMEKIEELIEQYKDK